MSRARTLAQNRKREWIKWIIWMWFWIYMYMFEKRGQIDNDVWCNQSADLLVKLCMRASRWHCCPFVDIGISLARAHTLYSSINCSFFSFEHCGPLFLNKVAVANVRCVIVRSLSVLQLLLSHKAKIYLMEMLLKLKMQLVSRSCS